MNLTSPTQVKSWCIENGFHPNRVLGQNFLIDHNALQAIVKGSEITAGMNVLEIGPGLGVLTEAILQEGASVTAVEKDQRLAGRLAAAMGNPSALEVIAADALEINLDELLSRGFDASISNLPYSVGTRILLDLALHSAAPSIITVLVQKEVAERFAADAGEAARGQSGVWLQLDYDVRILRHVSPACFWPRPEVASSIVVLRRRRATLSVVQRETFFALTRYAFMHRRKQLAGSLRKAGGVLERNESEITKLLETSGIEPFLRAEQISNAQWQALSRAYSD